MPPISRYMTRQPWTIERYATLTAAHQIMRRHAIRHLPVMDHGQLVGIVSERDLHLVETLPDADPDEATVEDAMTETVYVVAPGDALSDVVHHMAARKLGSVVVMSEPQRVEGIFTSVDALDVLANLLRRTGDAG